MLSSNEFRMVTKSLDHPKICVIIVQYISSFISGLETMKWALNENQKQEAQFSRIYSE